MEENAYVNTQTAQLRNVIALLTGVERAENRPQHLPGLVCFYGPSGWGKSYAAAYVANTKNAYYVELKSTWTVKYLLQAICKEMGLTYSTGDMLAALGEMVTEQLILSGRTLIIDEFDYLVDKNKVDVIRDLFEGSAAPVILIGEEQLPNKLKRWERTHGRILDFIPAQPASFEDAQALHALYCGKVEVADDLLDKIWKLSRGSVRRICVNLERVRQTAITRGQRKISLEDWGDEDFFTGEAPSRRV